MHFTKGLLLKMALIIVILAVTISIYSIGEKRPYPQHPQYVGSLLKPNSGQTQEAKEKIIRQNYVDWVNKYVKASTNTSGGYYIYMGGDYITTSEAMGYGMMTFPLMAGANLSDLSNASGVKDAKIYFDGLVKFHQAHLRTTTSKLITWAVNTSEGNVSKETATDGDLDMAYGLILAHEQWGSTGTYNYKFL